MPDTPESTTPTSGAEAPRSIRDVAEAAYDEVIGEASPEPSEHASVSERSPAGERPRDERGRFVPKEAQTGEAELEAPSPDKTPEAQTRPEPAPPRESIQGTEHWSAEDRAVFDRLPQDAKSFFLRRYQEMEGDYTRKSQANAAAVQTVNALAPIFNDPEIARSLQEMQFHPVQAIQEWARVHKLAASPDPRIRASILYELTGRMGFDPAKVFASNRPQAPLSPEQAKDPAIQYFADQASKAQNELQALRADFNQLRAQTTGHFEGEALKATRWSIDNFADEKDQGGRPLRPYFDRVLPTIYEMYKINPERDLQEAYEQACWMDKGVREELIRAQWSQAQHANSNARAAQAARSNVRGLTSPVAKQVPPKKGNGSLRDTLEASADEVGLS